MASIRDRIFTRTGKKQSTPRFYIDLRDLGLGQKALIPPGAKRATTDEELVRVLAEQKLEEALEAKKRRVQTGVREVAKLEEYAKRHIRLKEEAGEVSDSPCRSTGSRSSTPRARSSA